MMMALMLEYPRPTPAQKLDVVGNVQFSGALMPGALPGTSGQVLTSSGASTAPTWTSPTNALFNISTWLMVLRLSQQLQHGRSFPE